MGRSKLVQSLYSVYTCTKMLLIFVLGDANIDYRERPADAEGPKIDQSEAVNQQIEQHRNKLGKQ